MATPNQPPTSFTPGEWAPLERRKKVTVRSSSSSCGAKTQNVSVAFVRLHLAQI